MSESPEKLSLGYLLLGFFEFYAFSFESDRQCIDIRNYGKDGDSTAFRPRSEFVSEAKAEIKDRSFNGKYDYGPHLPPGLERHDQYQFLIADPFNRTYSPAKILANTEAAIQYQQAFKKAFMMLKHG